MSDRAALGVAAVVVLAAFVAPPVPPASALLFVAAWAVCRRAPLLVVALVLLVGGRAADSLAALEQPPPARLDGHGQLVSDPEAGAFDVRFVVRVDGRRYVAEVPHEHAAAVRGMLTGEWVQLAGTTAALRDAPRGWVRSQHLAGRLAVREVHDAGRSPPWYRIANSLHRVLGAGSGPFGDRRPLFLGLVIGDDRGQDDLTRFRFEASGLTHLLAVSGSNVAFVLAVAAPLLRRIGRRGRVIGGVAVVTLFALVTRAEPSVLRASVMAVVALSAVGLGRVTSGLRVLAISIVLLVVADPLLVHAVGFQLSVAATTGLLVLARPVEGVLPGPSWLRLPLAVTLAAQLATAPLLIGLSGGLPAAATVANLLAAPAAGAVMMLGITGGLLAGMAGETTAQVVQFPAVQLVRWIDLVAAASSRAPLAMLDPPRLAVIAAGIGAAALARTERRRRGRVTGRVGAACACAVLCFAVALRPATPAPGTHRAAPGVELTVGRCGGRVVSLDGVGGHRRVLHGLWRAGVRRVDVVVVAARRSDVAAAATLAEQLVVGRVVTPADRPPPGVESLAGRQLVVGGVAVEPDGTVSSTGGPSEGDRCPV